MIITSLICFFISGKSFSKNDKSRGFISGIKIGLIYSIIFLIITLIFFRSDFKLLNIIYYIFIVLSSMFGGMMSSYNKENTK